jgi:hypothetical protein
MTRALVVALALLTTLPAIAVPAASPSSVVAVADDEGQQGLKRTAEPDDGRGVVGRAPPSRGGAFAGGYMAATGLGTLWIANAAAWWGLVALSALAPPLAPLALGGVCTSGAVLCGMPLAQGVLAGRLGDAMGGYDSWLAYVLAVVTAYASAIVIGGGTLVAALLISQALVPVVGAPVTTTAAGAAQLQPTAFAIHAGVALGLAAGAFLIQPLVPAAVFATTAAVPGPFRQKWRKMRDDSDGDIDGDDETDLDDEGEGTFEVRARPPSPTALAMQY